MISSITSQPAYPSQGGMDPAKMQQKFEEKFAASFGEDALESIKDVEGNIDIEKLDAFLAANGIEKPTSKPPSPPEMGMFSDGQGGMDIQSLLEKVVADFGEEAAEDIQNEDGSVNFEKLKELLDEKTAEKRSGQNVGSGFMNAIFSGEQTLINAYA